MVKNTKKKKVKLSDKSKKKEKINKRTSKKRKTGAIKKSNIKEKIDKKEGKEKKDDKKSNLKSIGKILKDNEKNNESKEFDLLFLIDATGSMGPYINAARDESKNISEELRGLYPEMNFRYGYVFYRDPIDSPSDKHEVINLTDNVNALPDRIKKIVPTGGGDLPEDWVGAYKKANEEISWRNGNKVIIHLADAGAHGKEFTPYDKYKDEGEKLMYELDKCFQKNIKIFGYVIAEDARKSFNECQKIYKEKGGEYEIIDFIQQNNTSSYYPIDYIDYEDDIEEEEDADISFEKMGRSTSRKKSKRKEFRSYKGRGRCKKSLLDEDKMMFEKYEETRKGFSRRVITSVKSALKKK